MLHGVISSQMFDMLPLFAVAQQASGYESEDTLSDGGDFLDEGETELPIDIRRSTLQRMSSIPIVSVTKVCNVTYTCP